MSSDHTHGAIWTAQELLEAIASRGAVVFGTGYVANTLFWALDARGLWGKVRACIVSSTPEPGTTFHGTPVLRAQDTALHGEILCLAVHETLAGEILAHVPPSLVDDTVWAYPLLPELVYGKPLRREDIDVARLVRSQGDDHHWLAVRALVLENPQVGEGVYLKTQQLHCSPNTARVRLDAFRELARSFDERGFDKDRPLLVDENLHVIDGLHRLVLAWEHGVWRVPCNVVASSAAYDQLVGPANRLPPDELVRADLTDEELFAVQAMQRRMLEPRPLVSVILPAYNVADYLDQCMESLVGQTMPDFEAILVNDGSTDATLERCRAWEARDGRIRVMDQPNAGVSAARNAGLVAARGTWLAFVDPDDWLDPRYLELLLCEAARTGADRVECDLWRYDNRSGKATQRACGGRMGVPYTREEQMRYGPTASYKAITMRSVWEDNHVRFPACDYESPAVYALVVALAKKLAYVPRPLYWYRRFRENSLVETGYAKAGQRPNPALGVEAMETLVRNFAERGLLERYGGVLEGVVKYRLSDMLAMYHHRRSEADFAELVANYRAFLERTFGDTRASRYLVLGGYNLGRVLLHLSLLQDPRGRFNFSSVIAVADETPCTLEVSHKNRYREMMVRRELSRGFWDLLASEQPGIVFWDLMEERFDVAQTPGGAWVTLSDAFTGCEGIPSDLRVVRRDSEACRELWQRGADSFLARVAELSPTTRVVVVESYLAERVGNLQTTHEHENVDAIRATNRTLAGYYAYLRERHPEITHVGVTMGSCTFTDENHEYGVVPSHLNEVENVRIARLVEAALAGDKPRDARPTT